MKRTIQRRHEVRDRLNVGPVILQSLKGKVRMTVHHEGRKKSNIAFSAAEALSVAEALRVIAHDAIDKTTK